MRRLPDWSAEELAALKRMWLSPEPLSPEQIAARLPGGRRSPFAARTKANDYGWVRNPVARSAILSASRRGRVGRKALSPITDAMLATIKDLWLGDNDETAETIAAKVGCSAYGVRSLCRRNGWERNPDALYRFRSRAQTNGGRKFAGRPTYAPMRPQEWPPHRFQDDPVEAARSLRAIPIKMTPSGFLGSIVGCSAAMAVAS